VSEEAKVVVKASTLHTFCAQVFERLAVSSADAEIAADVLVAASLRGIESHGVSRLRRYVKGLQDGTMLAHPEERVVRETATTALIDAGAGLGQPVSYRAMKRAIDKAEKQGVGLVAVRNSNHYGIAGYYAMMALEHGMIGLSMTNANASVVPTHGQDAMLGTNPIAVAAPAGQEYPFVLDMATSIVPVGKLVVYRRQGKQMPEGWAIDEAGSPTTNTVRVLNNRLNRRGGGLLPLGGAGELFGGHKGYGLALLVDILSGVLSGAGYADYIHPKALEGKSPSAKVGHFFAAIKVEAFRPLGEFKAAMDDLIRRLKNSHKAESADHLFIHGEKEFEETKRRAMEGIPMEAGTRADLEAIAGELGVEYHP